MSWEEVWAQVFVCGREGRALLVPYCWGSVCKPELAISTYLALLLDIHYSLPLWGLELIHFASTYPCTIPCE